MRVGRAKRGLWYDTPSKLKPLACQLLRRAGCVGVVRYVARWLTDPDSERPAYQNWFYVLSRREVGIILASGLELSVVQAAKTTGKPYLNYGYGLDLGRKAAGNCLRLGLPPGITVWWDAEWTDGPSVSQVLACGTGWAQAVAAAGYRPGVYVGYDGVSGPQWYTLARVYHYWGSAMQVQSPQPSLARHKGHNQRGWQLRQGLEQRLPVPGYPGGLDVDPNLASSDDRGERFYALYK